MKAKIIALFLVWAAAILIIAAGPVVAEQITEYEERGGYYE